MRHPFGTILQGGSIFSGEITVMVVGYADQPLTIVEGNVDMGLHDGEAFGVTLRSTSKRGYWTEGDMCFITEDFVRRAKVNP